MSESPVALCLFGSVARGKVDEASDKDLLVVCDDHASIPQDVKSSWNEQGWSPTYYTWQKLLNRAVKGDLLLQHLKQEGVIIDDESGQLQRIINDFAPRADYLHEVEKTLVLLRPADRREGPLWQQQLLCGAIHRFLRHAMMHILASRQRYVFDYEALVTEFAGITDQIDASDVAVLKTLRKYRAQHDQRKAPGEKVTATLDAARELSTKLFGFEFLEIAADADARLLMPYSTILDIEARILAHHTPVEMDKGELLPDIWKLIKNPIAFNWAAGGQVDEEVLRSINVAVATAAGSL
ncbi:MAG: nucleotidyltransferase domain-containing protein [Pseudomonadota bacterium]